MSRISKSRLLATSAIVGLAIVNPASPVSAQDSFGIHNNTPETLQVTVAQGETVVGTDIGVYADNGAVDIDNAGTIRGNGTSLGSIDDRPSGGVVIAQPGATVTNSGTISGAASGVATSYFFSEDENGDNLPPEALAAETVVSNSGLIRGEAGNGVALVGGGTVTNSGTIQAVNGNVGNGAQAIGVVIAEFPEATSSTATGVGSLANTNTGLIEGQLFGVLLAGGGTIDNAGTIRSTGGFNPATPNVSPFGIVLTANADQPGRAATLNNSGTVSGFLGLLANQQLETATINNSGTIAGQQTGIIGLNSGDLVINNQNGGQITGNGPAIASNAGTLTVSNNGFIRSNGQAAINITTADAVIENNGGIQGGTFGITTNPFQVSPGVFEDRSVNTSVTNTGTIVGLNNDGVRLQGGGTVTNAGLIYGQQNIQADGVSMFALVTQDLADYSALVTNLEGGEINGIRTGVALSSGGTIDNAGEISGGGAGILIQNGLDGTPVSGAIINSGSILGDAGGAGVGGEGVVTYGLFDTLSVANSGQIVGGASDGVYVNTTRETAVTLDNADTGEIVGGASGVHIELGNLTLTNAGVIRGNGGNQGFDAAPDAGVTISGGENSIVNSGTISGNRFGITTANYFDPATGQLQGLAVDTSVVNSGAIIGENDDGVRLIGGGSVTNSGEILGLAGDFTDGISMFAYTQQPNEDYSALVTNEADGAIGGTRFGIILSGGGDVANAGDITGVVGGIFIQGTAQNSDPDEDRSGLTASVVNSGTITGTGPQQALGSSGNGYGVGFGSDMSTATLENSGTITSEQSVGVSHGSLADLTVTNSEGGVITGATSGIYGAAGGTLVVNNAGTIRGEGSYDGFDAVPDAGITIGTADSSVTNSGTISGAGAGITTAYLFDDAIGQLVFLAAGTTVENSGVIAGESNDGVRLIGGGSVTNSGAISGSGAAGADGVSMFRYDVQEAADYSATVTNSADGAIDGDRFGIILSGGGAIDNAGLISGDLGGIVIQSQFNGEDAGLTGTLTNSGAITGLTGAGAQFSAGLASVVVDNSGTIDGATVGVAHGTDGTLTLTNSGSITGGNSGVTGNGGAAIVVDNSGTIRGNGTVDTAARVDAGIAIGRPNSLVTNSGTISGAVAGISTFAALDPATGQTLSQTFGVDIVNSGTISGDTNDGIRLFGGGTVTNSGTIEGLTGFAADGIQMNSYTGQALETYEAVITNEADGAISGFRYGVIALGGGGSLTNAGDIAGGIGGVLIQGNNAVAGSTGSIVNSGTIASTQGIGIGLAGGNLAAASLTNSGAISGNVGALINAAASTVDNAAGASITGVQVGVTNNLTGTLAITNAGTIAATTGGGIFSAGQTSLVNSGTIIGGNGIAVQLGAFDDNVTLQTGSAITGVINAGDGIDSLTLEGDVLELTEAQQLTSVNGFETLDVAAGYWSTAGVAGAFDSVAIAAGAALQVNEVDLGEEGLASPIETAAVQTDGLLVLNFGADETVSSLDALTISGAGQLQLIGDAVFTVDTANIAHSGGTVISNGGLLLSGTLLGDVTTAGDGFFQLGAGGTEGSFSGNIVNDGRFVFNRSDDYGFEGAFTGSGTLDKMGDGVLTFLGDYGFQGVTNILGGAVRIGGTIDPTTDFDLGAGGTLDITGKDQTIGGLEGDAGSNVVIGDSQLTVAQDDNTAFGGSIDGDGSLVKEGNGTLNLTGDSSYTGPTAVNGGTLAVNGSIVSPVTVNEGGTLGGNGAVGSTTVGSGGTIAPGNSIGRLTVNGDLAFAPGAIYEVEVNAAGAADRLDATGAVTIANSASVAVLAENGNYSPRTDYVILTGAGGITGAFGTVTSDLAFLDPLLRYSPNSVTLSLYRNDIDFADVAIGFSQVQVAGAVQALGINNPVFEAVLVQNAATAQASFGQLSGEILASAVSGLTDDSRHLRNALMGMRAPEEGGAFIWGSAFGSWGDFDANRGNAGMETDHQGLVTGIGIGGNGFAAALSAGISNSDFRLDSRNDRAEAESKYLTAHATYGAATGLRGTIGVSYAWHDVDTTRAISIASLGQTLSSKRDATTLQLFGELGYQIVNGNLMVTPFARLAHVDTDSDAFSEAGGSAALTVAGGDQKATFLSLGARAQANAGLPGFQPYVSAAWNRAFDDRSAVLGSRFTTGATPFAILGNAIPKNSAEVEAGFDFVTGLFRIGAAYTGTLASNRDTHGARITARIAF